MVIATVHNFQCDVVYTSEAGTLDQVWSELKDIFDTKKYLMTLSDDEDEIFIDGRHGLGMFHAEVDQIPC